MINRESRSKSFYWKRKIPMTRLSCASNSTKTEPAINSIRVDEVSAQSCFDFVPLPLLQKSSSFFSRPLLHPTHTQFSVLPIVYVKERDVFGQNKIYIFHLPRLVRNITFLSITIYPRDTGDVNNMSK
jgi:hypothetical protein